MKRILLTGAALAVAGLSLFQLRLSDAQTPGDETLSNTLPILTESTEQKLTSIRKQLNTDDPTTKRFDELIDSAAGKLALAGLLNQLTSSARNELRSDALSRFLEARFDTVANGKLVLRPEHSEWVESWTSRGERINDYLTKLRETNDQLASEMDPDSDAGKLFKRLLEDPQSHAAILLVEMKHGGDAVDKFLAEALDKVLVERGDGTYQIVPSRREEAQKLIERLDLATELDQKLQRQMPAWSNEFDASDENHRRLIRYMSQPEMATVMALQISDDRDFASAAAAAEELFGRLETVSVDTPTGLRIERKEVWQQFDEIFRTVDRVTGLLAPIEERLTALSSTLATEDPLASKLKEHMRQRPLATLVAAELPYAAAEPGDQLRVMLDSVLVETSDGKLRVRDDHAEEVAEKAKQLLQACRTIRRHLISIDAMLERIEDQKLLSQLGDSRSYLILNEVKRYAEQQRFDSVELLKGSILVENADGRWQIDQQHRDIVRRLVEQAQQVADEASNDDF